MFCIVPADHGTEHAYFARAAAVVQFLLITITHLHLFAVNIFPETYVLHRHYKIKQHEQVENVSNQKQAYMGLHVLHSTSSVEPNKICDKLRCGNLYFTPIKMHVIKIEYKRTNGLGDNWCSFNNMHVYKMMDNAIQCIFTPVRRLTYLVYRTPVVKT